MNELIFFDTLREGLWSATLISAPLLAIALVVGLIVGLLQALTSIQEMTLTFVPKLLAMMLVFWVSMDFMTKTLTDFFQGSVISIIGMI